MKKLVCSILISLLLLIPVKMNAEIKSETLIEALEKEVSTLKTSKGGSLSELIDK